MHFGGGRIRVAQRSRAVGRTGVGAGGRPGPAGLVLGRGHSADAADRVLAGVPGCALPHRCAGRLGPGAGAADGLLPLGGEDRSLGAGVGAGQPDPHRRGAGPAALSDPSGEGCCGGGVVVRRPWGWVGPDEALRAIQHLRAASAADLTLCGGGGGSVGLVHRPAGRPTGGGGAALPPVPAVALRAGRSVDDAGSSLAALETAAGAAPTGTCCGLAAERAASETPAWQARAPQSWPWSAQATCWVRSP